MSPNEDFDFLAGFDADEPLIGYSGSRREEAPSPTLPPAAGFFLERCAKCAGTGRWGYYRVGQCFACKGKGTIARRTSPEVRAKARDKAAAKKRTAEDRTAATAREWREANPSEAAWLDAKAPTFEFAASLRESLTKWGRLTDGQFAAVRRLIDKDAERAAERVTREAAAPALTIEAIETAFASAREKGIKRPKMKLASYVFSPAPAHGVNAGAIYVKHGEEYLGKIKDGAFRRSFSCTSEDEKNIVEVASNPREAAIAYGRRTGSCAICSRELTNSESIELGIGPICAARYGW